MDDFVFDPNDMDDFSFAGQAGSAMPAVEVKDAAELIARAAAGEQNFPKMSLPKANLVGAELHGLRFCGSDLQQANLTGADLRQCQMRDVNLRGANLTGAQLEGADLSGADLREAQLSNADLHEALLPCANLQKAHCYHSQMAGADLNEVNFSQAQLEGCNLEGANLGEANFQKANLRWANLRNASLRAADLRAANLSETQLAHANLQDIKYDRRAQYRGVDVETIRGNPLFRRFAQDQDYIEAFKAKHPVSYWIWLIFADCGRSLSVWGAWAIFIAMLFALIYWGLSADFIIHDSAQRQHTLLTWFYYSVVTFTSLGYGDIVPRTSLGEILVIIEVGGGYLMLGGMVSILANKLARRS